MTEWGGMVMDRVVMGGDGHGWDRSLVVMGMDGVAMGGIWYGSWLGLR